MMGNNKFEKHCWAEIDVEALMANFAYIKNKVNAPVCAVVKANAYGHGSNHIARYLQEAGASAFAVSCLSEAVQLRDTGIVSPIIILGYTDPSMVKMLAEKDIITACISPEYAEMISRSAYSAGVKVRVHLKVDTGMGRIGFQVRQNFGRAIDELSRVYELPGLSVEGMFQHFAVADSIELSDMQYTAEQYELFQKVIEALKGRGLKPGVVHCANSAAQLTHPEWHCDMVRAGIVLYGLNPSNDMIFSELKPVMSVKSVVTQVKEIGIGESTSYGRKFIAPKPTRVATVCVGYADGYPRMLSGNQRKGVMLVKGKAAPVIGRVCMDQTMLDVSNIADVQIGDEVIVFGGHGADTADSVAEKTDTINYEVITGISQRIPRIYVRQGEMLNIGYDAILNNNVETYGEESRTYDKC